jgi:hypothetical protein
VTSQVLSKVVRLHRAGGPEELKLEELPVGDPAVGEVRLRIEAIGLNRSEALYRAGGYPIKPNRRGASLLGIESADWQDCCDGVIGFKIFGYTISILELTHQYPTSMS